MTGWALARLRVPVAGPCARHRGGIELEPGRVALRGRLLSSGWACHAKSAARRSRRPGPAPEGRGPAVGPRARRGRGCGAHALDRCPRRRAHPARGAGLSAGRHCGRYERIRGRLERGRHGLAATGAGATDGRGKYCQPAQARLRPTRAPSRKTPWECARNLAGTWGAAAATPRACCCGRAARWAISASASVRDHAGRWLGDFLGLAISSSRAALFARLALLRRLAAVPALRRAGATASCSSRSRPASARASWAARASASPCGWRLRGELLASQPGGHRLRGIAVRLFARRAMPARALGGDAFMRAGGERLFGFQSGRATSAARASPSARARAASNAIFGGPAAHRPVSSRASPLARAPARLRPPAVFVCRAWQRRWLRGRLGREPAPRSMQFRFGGEARRGASAWMRSCRRASSACASARRCACASFSASSRAWYRPPRAPGAPPRRVARLGEGFGGLARAGIALDRASAAAGPRVRPARARRDAGRLRIGLRELGGSVAASCSACARSCATAPRGCRLRCALPTRQEIAPRLCEEPRWAQGRGVLRSRCPLCSRSCSSSSMRAWRASWASAPPARGSMRLLRLGLQAFALGTASRWRTSDSTSSRARVRRLIGLDSFTQRRGEPGSTRHALRFGHAAALLRRARWPLRWPAFLLHQASEASAAAWRARSLMRSASAMRVPGGQGPSSRRALAPRPRPAGFGCARADSAAAASACARRARTLHVRARRAARASMACAGAVGERELAATPGFALGLRRGERGGFGSRSRRSRSVQPRWRARGLLGGLRVFRRHRLGAMRWAATSGLPVPRRRRPPRQARQLFGLRTSRRRLRVLARPRA